MTIQKLAKGLQTGISYFPSGPKRSRENQYRHGVFFREVSLRNTESVPGFLNSSLNGLTEGEADTRLKAFGLNEIAHEKKNPWYRRLFRSFLNPFILLLTVLAVVSLATDDERGALVMAIMVLVSVSLTFFQEFRSSRAAEKLKRMVSTNATVTRIALLEGHSGEPENRVEKKELPISHLVPGDLVSLAAGDMIPADVRLVASKDLFVSQSTLTGESVPAEKFSNQESDKTLDLLELKNLCFMGTNVVSGAATAIVLKTGSETYFGSLAKSLVGTRVETSFDKGIHRFTWLMLRFMFVMVPLVFLVNGLTKGNWFDAFLFAIAVAVGLTPEMLPMIVTVNLAKGALSMAKKRVIVKRLNAIQNFGAMDVLCTDKTGTLTQDRVILEKYVDALGAQSGRVLRFAFINSFYQTGLKNLLDIALLKHFELFGELGIENHYRKIDEIPFDFTRKRMSVIVEKDRSSHVLICKGALEELFPRCTRAELNGQVLPIEKVPRDRIFDVAGKLNDDGLRVIAVAYKEIEETKAAYSVADETDLTLLGYIAFLDPPKETAIEAIQALGRYGVRVKVLTGDNDRVTRKVCEAVGISVENLLLGHEIDALGDEELATATEITNVFAKLTPVQKQRIVHAMHRKGHVVGFLGDGINDSSALRTADVGISVDNAVDIAKESADIILLEKSLLVLEAGVLEGRKVFGNIIKYIKMGASSNFGNVFSLLGASLFLPFLPMLPVQLLTQNLLYDLSQTAIPFDEVDEEYLKKPRRWEIADIGRFMFFLGPVSSLFDYATFALMWFVFKAHSPASQSLFQTGWFVEGLLSQALIVHMIRTQKVPFLQSRAAWPLMLTTVLVVGIGLYLPFSSMGLKIGLVPLPLAFFPWLVGFLLLYCATTQVVKNVFIKRYGFH